MQHQVLCALAGFDSEPIPHELVHPGEAELYARLGRLGQKFKQIQTSRSAIFPVIKQRVVLPYQETLVQLEEDLLRTGIPMTLVLSELSPFEPLFHTVLSLQSENSQSQASNSIPEICRLLREVNKQSHSAIGMSRIFHQECLHMLSGLYFKALIAFLVYGQTGTLVVKDTRTGGYVFPPESLPTSSELLQNALTNICLALSILHSIAKSAKLQPEITSLIQAELARCSGPFDHAFHSAIINIQDLLSTHLLNLHLPIQQIQDHITLFSSTFCLQSPLFASNLTIELAALEKYPTHQMNFSLALFRATIGTTLEDDPLMECFSLSASKSPTSLFKLEFTPSEAMGLFLTHQVMSSYEEIFLHLAYIKSLNSRLFLTWHSLANSQRKRRVFTGATEGGLTKTETKRRESIIRTTWSAIRCMLWWIQTLDSHFHSNVIKNASEFVFDLLYMAQNSGDTPVLDFTGLTRVHAMYLDVLQLGLLMQHTVLRTTMERMMQQCDALCVLIQKWGGDVLPGLLEGSLSLEQDIQMVNSRMDQIEDINRHFEVLLKQFVRMLSEPTTTNTLKLSILSKSISNVAKNTNPVIDKAQRQAESIGREFYPQLLLSLDFGRWFSLSAKRNTRTTQEASLIDLL